MATNNADVNVVCPYYQKSDNGFVQCEGIGDDTTAIKLLFRNPETGKPLKEDKTEFMTNRCESWYERCPVYKMLEEKYECK